MKKYCVLITLLVFALLVAPSFAQTTAPTPEVKKGGDETAAGQTSSTGGKVSKASEKTDNQAAGKTAQAKAPEPAEQLRDQLRDLERRLKEQQTLIGKQKERLDLLTGNPEDPQSPQNNLGPLDWLTSPFIFWPFVGLILLALGLHVLHLLRGTHMSQSLEQLWKAQQQRVTGANRGANPTGKNGAVEGLAEQVRQQGQGLSQFTTQLNQLQTQLAERDQKIGETLQAVALTANWVGQFQLREAAASDGGSISEANRSAAITILSRYQEPLRVNAGRVEPLAQAMAGLVEKLEAQPQLTSELGRAQKLYQEIGQFDMWHRQASEQLASLQRGSFARRSSMLQSDQQHLIEQVNAGAITITQMVQRSKEMLDQRFPLGAQRVAATPVTTESEAELKQRVESAPEYLMNWFDNFFQLQNHLSAAQSSNSPSNAEIVSAAAQVQRAAREALGKFDIQPEEIQAGRTAYDRRLHEASLVRQSSQFPINTVIEVLRCGFRRMSTGEVLRRPQVVVAGAVGG